MTRSRILRVEARRAALYPTQIQLLVFVALSVVIQVVPPRERRVTPGIRARHDSGGRVAATAKGSLSLSRCPYYTSSTTGFLSASGD